MIVQTKYGEGILNEITYGDGYIQYHVYIIDLGTVYNCLSIWIEYEENKLHFSSNIRIIKNPGA